MEAIFGLKQNKNKCDYVSSLYITVFVVNTFS